MATKAAKPFIEAFSDAGVMSPSGDPDLYGDPSYPSIQDVKSGQLELDEFFADMAETLTTSRAERAAEVLGLDVGPLRELAASRMFEAQEPTPRNPRQEMTPGERLLAQEYEANKLKRQMEDAAGEAPEVRFRLLPAAKDR